ncbi:hypothetical protein D3C75_1191460 [compost metagenome]
MAPPRANEAIPPGQPVISIRSLRHTWHIKLATLAYINPLYKGTPNSLETPGSG